MILLNLSWTSKETSGHLKSFNWNDVEQKLEMILDGSGTVIIYAEDENELPREIQIRSENNAFLVTLGIETSDDWVVKTFNNHMAAPSCQIEILGDLWSEKLVTYDKSKVVQAFAEFYNTGNVSEDSLN